MKTQRHDSSEMRALLHLGLIYGLIGHLIISLSACIPQQPPVDHIPSLMDTSQNHPAAVPTAPTAPAGWRHTRSKLAAGLGDPAHSAVDAIVNPRTAASVRGKFAYGAVSKDLQDEEVWLQIVGLDDSWVSVSRGLTDSDGRVTLSVPYRHLTRFGPNRYRFLVSGDLSVAEGRVWVLKRATEVVVFDIDGTLTTGDSELIDDAFGGDIDARKGAVEVVKHWVDAGHLPVYLTGRPYMYNRSTRAWLTKYGFPHGPMATADSLGQAAPSKDGVGRFKTDWLRALQADAGVAVRAAYGNASTDICAFARAGISPAATYIIANEQKSCEGFAEVNLIADENYLEHSASLRRSMSRQ